MSDAQSKSGLIALLLGGMIASGLFALSAMHLLQLLAGTRQPKDGQTPAYLKVTLPFLWGLDSLHFSFFVYALSVFLIKPEEKHLWSLTALLSTTVFRDTLIRILTARCMLFGDVNRRNRLKALGLVLLALIIFLLGIVVAFKDLNTNVKVPDFRGFSGIAFAYLAITFVCDSLLAAFRLQSKLLNRRQDKSKLECFIHAIVPCNLLTGIASLGAIITIAVIPNTLVFLGIHCSIASFSNLAFFSSLHTLSTEGWNSISITLPSTPLTKEPGTARLNSPLPPIPPLDFPQLSLTPDPFLASSKPSADQTGSPSPQIRKPVPPEKLDITTFVASADKRSSPISPFDDMHEAPRLQSQSLSPPPRFTSLFIRSPTVSSFDSSERDLHCAENQSNSSLEHGPPVPGSKKSYAPPVDISSVSPPDTPPAHIRTMPMDYSVRSVTISHPNRRLHKSLHVGSGIEGIKALLDLKSPTPSVSSSKPGSNGSQADARSVRSWRSKSASFARSASLSSCYSRPGTAESVNSHTDTMPGWERRDSVYDLELGEDHDYFKADENNTKGAFGPYRLSSYNHI